MTIKETLQVFARFFRRACRRLTRADRTATPARSGLLRAEFECLESRSMLSLAPVDDGYRLDFDRLPKLDFGDIAIWPIRPIEGGALPLPPGFPSLPPPQYEPYPPFPPSESPDSSDVGGFTDIDNSDKGQPGILVGPASDKIAREVLQMLESLRYIPTTHDTDDSTQSALAPVTHETPATLPAARRLVEFPEGGMIALLHDAVIVHSVAQDAATHDDIDVWLNIPVRMDSAPGKFQAFEISTGEAPPTPPLPPVNEASFLTPLSSPFELAPSATVESTSLTSVSVESTPAGGQSTSETTLPDPSLPAVPPEVSRKNSSSKHAAAAAIFVFLAVRAARAARTTDTSEPQSQATVALRRPSRSDPAP